MRPIRALITAPERTAPTMATPMIPSTVTTQQQRSPWHSPVPYLFGGLAAMLGLIAFALLILACSYWRLSSRAENGSDGDLENGNEKEGDGSKTVTNKVYEEKFLVIMAGDQKPTFLATPVSNKASCLGDQTSKIQNSEDQKTENNEDKSKGQNGNHNQTVEEQAENQNGQTHHVQDQSH